MFRSCGKSSLWRVPGAAQKAWQIVLPSRCVIWEARRSRDNHHKVALKKFQESFHCYLCISVTNYSRKIINFFHMNWTQESLIHERKNWPHTIVNTFVVEVFNKTFLIDMNKVEIILNFHNYLLQTICRWWPAAQGLRGGGPGWQDGRIG